MRAPPLLPAALFICCAVCRAAMTGAVTATVNPDCLNSVSCTLCVRSRASTMVVSVVASYTSLAFPVVNQKSINLD